MNEKIKAFCEKYGIQKDEIWQPRQGGSWAVKHEALERVAAQEKMEQVALDLCRDDMEHKAAIVKAQYRKNGSMVASFGEAAPYNNKNAYPVAMAEKRAIDRCILKLCGMHGTIYSEEEAESFAQPSAGSGRLLKTADHAKDLYRECERALRHCKSPDMLDEYNKAYKSKLRSLPLEYEQELSEEWNRMAEEFSFGRSI